jgi:gas vesicle protein
MSDRNGSDFGSFLSGFLMGGLIGAAVALLMAPQSGEETRKLIREKGIELRDQASDSLETAAADARARADELTRMAKERTAELRGRAEDIRARGEAAIEAAKKSPSKRADEKSN